MRALTRSAALCLLSLALLLFPASAALAADGVGLYGRTDDKVVTLFAFGVLAFFVVIIVSFTIIQSRLESRKDRAREELDRLRRP